MGEHLGLPVCIDQRHHAFLNIHGDEFLVTDLDFGIDQRSTNGIGGIRFHKWRPFIAIQRRMIPEAVQDCPVQ